MKDVKEIFHWRNMGQDPADQEISKCIKPGEIGKLTGKQLIEFLTWKGNFSDTFDEKKEYFVYYNFHPTSGYKTSIFQDKEDFKVEITKPRGMTLQAFSSEGIVFEKK